MSPSLIALDLDGTLLRSDATLSPRSAKAIRDLRAEKIQIVLCTGRPPRYTESLARELNLEACAVVYNGASICDFRAGTAEHLHQLSGATARAVITKLRDAHPGVLTGLETVHGWYLDSELYEQRKAVLKRRNLPLPDGAGDMLDFLDAGAIKILVRHPELAAPLLAEALRDLDVYATWSSESLLEVQHPKTNKRTALEHLCDKLGLEPSSVAAFGDQNNDVEMLSWAGTGVAVANAAPEAKRAADLITLSNDKDGVAALLETWL